MRDIKFRAWDMTGVDGAPIEAMWYEDDVCSHGDIWCIGNLAGNALMQYTGLKDKNGKEIYEGDICEWIGAGNMISGNIFAISWVEKRAAWYLGDCLRPIDMEFVKIIGNIYENPELLEAS